MDQQEYKSVSIGELIEREILTYLNSFGHFRENNPPVLVFPPIFSKLVMKYIKYQSAIYNLACIYLTDESASTITVVCRKQHLKHIYQERYEELFSYKEDDAERVDPVHLSNYLNITVSTVARKNVRQQLGLPLSSRFILSCTQRQMDVNLQWKYEECKTKERLGYISTENRFLIPVSNPLSTNSAILIQPVPTCMPEPEKYPHIDLASYSNQSDSTSHIEYILNDGMENENFGTLYEREYGTYMYDRLSDLRSPFQSTSS